MSGEHGGAGVSSEEFQGILQTRRLEKNKKAEEKRQEGLKRIQEMNSPKSGMEPAEIFPKEIWQMILDEVGPEDRGNTLHLHQTFRDLMANHKIRDILLPQYSRLELDSIFNNHEEQINFEDTYFDFDVEDYFHLREVSKTMNKEIDQLLDQALDKCLEDQFSASVIFELTLHLELPEFNDEMERLDQLLTRLQKGCVSRAFRIELFLDSWSRFSERDLSFGEAFPRFKKKIIEFLQQMGSRMWYFEFCLYIPSIAAFEEASGLTIWQLYLTIRELASLMPHLKWIRIHFGRDSSESVSKLIANTFASKLEKLPFPKLNELQRLDFRINLKRNELFQICDAMIAGNDHVTQVTFETDFDMPDSTQYCVPRIRNLPLTQLNVNSNSRFASIERDCLLSLSQLKSLLNPGWKLKQLKVSMAAEDESITSVFQLLQHYPALEKLELEIVDVTIGESEIPFLMLPNLTLFRLKLMPELDFSETENILFFFSLQFLLYAKNLRKIDWTNVVLLKEKQKLVRLMAKLGPKEMISFGGGWKDLTRSNNLWTVFPCLEEIHVDIDELKPSRQREDGQYGHVDHRNVYRVYERSYESCPKRTKKGWHLLR